MEKEFKEIIKFQERRRAEKIAELEKNIKEFLEDNRMTLGDALIVLDVVTHDLLEANAQYVKSIYRGNTK